MKVTSTTTRRAAVTAAAVVLLLTACAPPPSANQAAASGAGAWLDRQFTSAGWFPGAFTPSTPDVVNGAQAIADLSVLGIGAGSRATRLARLEADAPAAIDDGTAYVPGTLARVILAVVASGGNPRSFAGTDLVADLESTIQPDGRFGSQFPGYDGSYRQGLALAALSVVTPRPASITPASGQSIDDVAAVAWLRAQQCADGSWMAFRATTTSPCVEDPSTWTYKDSNGSAMAALGLTAVGATAPVDPSGWFTSVRGSDGGWGAFPAGATTQSDADSTGLVIAALKALGHDPDESAYAALRSFQLGDTAAVADRGAFFYKSPDHSPNSYATLDALTALFDGVWPGVLAASHG
ncbi:MAG: hypothetical protein JST64_05550 [Actinobacteria bacterium]|nr:hypothetical protein [Actinomycetota bacterium]